MRIALSLSLLLLLAAGTIIALPTSRDINKGKCVIKQAVKPPWKQHVEKVRLNQQIIDSLRERSLLNLEAVNRTQAEALALLKIARNDEDLYSAVRYHQGAFRAQAERDLSQMIEACIAARERLMRGGNQDNNLNGAETSRNLRIKRKKPMKDDID